MTDYKLVPVEGLRYTFDGALAECPCCGSLDVGGAHDTVHCQSCGLTVSKPRPLQNAIDAWNMRTGRSHPAPAVQGEPVATVEVMPDGSQVWIALKTQWLPVGLHKLYTAPQPAEQQPDVAQLVEALEAAQKEAVRGINHARNGAQAAAALGRVSAIVGAALDAHRT